MIFLTVDSTRDEHMSVVNNTAPAIALETPEAIIARVALGIIDASVRRSSPLSLSLLIESV